jgi:WD40 repeat protein
LATVGILLGLPVTLILLCYAGLLFLLSGEPSNSAGWFILFPFLPITMGLKFLAGKLFFFSFPIMLLLAIVVMITRNRILFSVYILLLAKISADIVMVIVIIAIGLSGLVLRNPAKFKQMAKPALTRNNPNPNEGPGWSNIIAMRKTMVQPDEKAVFGNSEDAILKVSADNKKLYTFEIGGILKIWDVQQGTLVKKQHFDKPFRVSNPVKLSADRTRIIVENSIYELESGRLLAAFPVEAGKLLHFTGDLNKVILLRNGYFGILDYSQSGRNSRFGSVYQDTQTVFRIYAWSPDQRYFAFVDSKRLLRVADVVNQEIITTSQRINDPSIVRLCFSTNGKALAIHGDNGSLAIYSSPAWNKTIQLSLEDRPGGGCYFTEPVFFSIEKDLLLVAHSPGGPYRAYQPSTGKILYGIPAKSLYRDIVSPSGRWLVVNPEGPYNLILYNLENGQRMPDLCDAYCYGGGPQRLHYEFSADETELFVAGLNTLAAWKLNSEPSRRMFADPELVSR